MIQLGIPVTYLVPFLNANIKKRAQFLHISSFVLGRRTNNYADHAQTLQMDAMFTIKELVD